MKDIVDKLLSGDSDIGELAYEQAKELAGHENPKVREMLAARSDLKPEILYFLADDPSPEVRRVLAENSSTPSHADLLLASDSDLDVRGGLAEKIARLAPGLSSDEQSKVQQMTAEALDILARDQVTRVRQILSEALKDVAGAPPEVIRQLAWDTELVVAGPILEFSPVLTDEDLLEIIDQGAAAGRLSAISKRAEVPETIVDAIVATSDEEAVAFLLDNHKAQIREETLDLILEQAPDVGAWHMPLVKRPVLSLHAATLLAGFVADNLLEILSEREDLESDVLEEIRSVVSERLQGDGKKPAEKSNERTPSELAHEQATGLHEAGELSEAEIAEALKSGKRDLVMASIAVRCELPMLAIQKVVTKKDAKGTVSMCWKAGLSARLAENIQTELVGIEAGKFIAATPDGSYALEDEDMEWQLEFIGDL